MDYLWTPWRYAYLSSTEKIPGCIFCDGPNQDDAKLFIVHRGQHCFVMLNLFPYTPGHMMIVPYAHVDEYWKLPAEAANEMTMLSQRAECVLREFHPDGINLGMNIGKAAGADVAAHIHQHVLPRWFADSNFLSVIGETRVLPQTLEVTWGMMKASFLSAANGQSAHYSDPRPLTLIVQCSDSGHNRYLTVNVPTRECGDALARLLEGKCVTCEAPVKVSIQEPGSSSTCRAAGAMTAGHP